MEYNTLTPLDLGMSLFLSIWPCYEHTSAAAAYRFSAHSKQWAVGNELGAGGNDLPQFPYHTCICLIWRPESKVILNCNVSQITTLFKKFFSSSLYISIHFSRYCFNLIRFSTLSRTACRFILNWIDVTLTFPIIFVLIAA